MSEQIKDSPKTEIDFRALTEEIEDAVLTYELCRQTPYYAKQRPIRPYNLNRSDLEPGLRVCILNTRFKGDFRRIAAQNFIIVSEIYEEDNRVPPFGASSYVSAHRVLDHITGQPTNGDPRQVCPIPLAHMGIEVDPETSLFYASTYTVPYEALATDPKLVLYC